MKTYSQILIFRQYIEKTNFPDSKLIKYFPQIELTFNNRFDCGYLLMFEHHMMVVSIRDADISKTVDSDYDKDEVIFSEVDQTLCFWKKGGKNIYYKRAPYDFDKK